MEVRTVNVPLATPPVPLKIIALPEAESATLLIVGTPVPVMRRMTSVAAVLVSLAGKKTILMIAHQMSTVRLCQPIFLLQDGALAGRFVPGTGRIASRLCGACGMSAVRGMEPA